MLSCRFEGIAVQVQPPSNQEHFRALASSSLRPAARRNPQAIKESNSDFQLYIMDFQAIAEAMTANAPIPGVHSCLVHDGWPILRA
jgi:hypothetical protein